MISFIKLTGENDRKYYISIKDITNINDINNAYDNLKSCVVTTGDIIYVKESCEEIIRKINEICGKQLLPVEPYHMYDYRQPPYYDKITCFYDDTKENNNEKQIP